MRSLAMTTDSYSMRLGDADAERLELLGASTTRLHPRS